jgi:Outer membrane protein
MAERKILESSKQDKNISRSEFLPSITVSGSQTSSTSINQTNQSGAALPDSNLDTESKSLTLEQKIFSGFKGVNTFKKSELELQKANLKLKEVEQKTILDTAFAYYDLIYKSNNEIFNISNVNLYERQVEFDSTRVQKGEITLTDLAQSESSLAGAKADLIKAKTELLSSKTNFKRVTGEEAPKVESLNGKIIVDLPNSLKSALELSSNNNINLLISKLEYEISEKDLAIERARFSPSASIEVSKSENRDTSSSINKKDEETVKAKISWPIKKGGENNSTIKKFS